MLSSNLSLSRARALAILLLSASLVAPSALAAVPAKDASCGCVLPWRTYERAATPAEEQLVRAAREVDEATFTRLIQTVPDLNAFHVKDQTVLTALLLPKAGLGWDRPNRKVRWEMSAEEARKLRALHADTLPAKTRMLKLALERGANPADTTYYSRVPPLHLATVLGTPEMVRLLLAHGANPNQLGGNDDQSPIEFALDHEYFMRMTYLPYLVDAPARTEMLLALLAAGADRPYRRLDEAAERDGEGKRERPSADYLIWPALAELTRGAEVLDAMAKTGTAPAADTSLSPLAHAARAGNLGGVKWLKARLPRTMSDGDPYGQGEKQWDLWLDAAIWALYPVGNGPRDERQVDAILAELLTPRMPWAQPGTLNDESHNGLLRHRVDAMPQRGYTLLHHLVFTGRADWIPRVVKLGAPIDGTPGADKALPVTPLAEAVTAGDLAMARKLLALGADPLAGPSREESPLYLAIYSDTRYHEENQALTPERRRELLAALVDALSPARKTALGKEENSPVAYALSRLGSVDPGVVRALLAAGFPATGVGADAVATALRNEDIALVNQLLDMGVSLRATGPDTPPLVMMALAWDQRALIPRLVRAGADPNQRSRDGGTAVDLAIIRADHAGLDLLLANGGRIEVAPSTAEATTLDRAVTSGDEKMLARVLPLWGGQLSAACLADADLLTETALGTDDAYWRALIPQGLGKPAPACAALPPMAHRLLAALIASPANVQAGWRQTRLNARLKDLWTVSGGLKPARAAELMSTANAAGRDDLILALRQLGVADAPPPARLTPAAVAKPTAQDKALAKTLVGHYYLENVREVGSEILLRKDGRFEYMLAYGAVDETASGTWTVADGQVVFRTPKTQAPAVVPYTLRAKATGSGLGPEAVSVSAVYEGHPISDLAVTAIGCEAPKSTRGASGDEIWAGVLDGKVCQLVLHHPRINGGRAFVQQIKAGDSRRHFVFDVQLPPSTGGELNVEMKVKDGALIWTRGGRELRYTRQ